MDDPHKPVQLITIEHLRRRGFLTFSQVYSAFKWLKIKTFYLRKIVTVSKQTSNLTEMLSQAWFPPVDTFLEIEIKTIATFIPRRQQHFQGEIFISPNKFLQPAHSHQANIITKLRRKNSFVKTKRWHADVVHCFWHYQL